MDKHVEKHAGKSSAKDTINRLISTGKIHSRDKKLDLLQVK